MGILILFMGIALPLIWAKRLKDPTFAPTAKIAVIVIVVVGVFMLGGAGLVYAVTTLMDPGITGQLSRVGGAKGSNWSLDASQLECSSAARFQERGVWIGNPSSGHLTVVEDTQYGYLVAVYDPGQKTPVTELNSRQCSTFKVGTSSTNVTINNVRAVQGSVELDCGIPGGGRIWGHVKFDRCS